MGKSTRCKYLLIGFTISMLNLLLITQALAQFPDSSNVDNTRKEPRFNISTSGIYTILETNLRFETLNGFLGLKINLEDHLSLDKYRVMPLFTTRIRIKNRHNLFGMYYSLPRQSTFVSKNDFEFNDVIIEPGTQLDSYFNLHAFSIGYSYSLIMQERGGLGVFANFFMAYANAGISSTLETINENISIIGVLPNFGLIPYYRLSDKLGLSGMISMFFLNLDEYGGSVHTVGAQIDAHITRWLQMGIGYYLFDVTLEVTEPNFRGYFDYTYQGPFIGLGFRF